MEAEQPYNVAGLSSIVGAHSDIKTAVFLGPYVTFPQEDLLSRVHQNIHVSIRDVAVGAGEIQCVSVELLSDGWVVCNEVKFEEEKEMLILSLRKPIYNLPTGLPTVEVGFSLDLRNYLVNRVLLKLSTLSTAAPTLLYGDCYESIIPSP